MRAYLQHAAARYAVLQQPNEGPEDVLLSRRPQHSQQEGSDARHAAGHTRIEVAVQNIRLRARGVMSNMPAAGRDP